MVLKCLVIGALFIVSVAVFLSFSKIIPLTEDEAVARATSEIVDAVDERCGEQVTVTPTFVRVRKSEGGYAYHEIGTRVLFRGQFPVESLTRVGSDTRFGPDLGFSWLVMSSVEFLSSPMECERIR